MNGLKDCLAPLVLIAILMTGSAQAQVFDEKYSHWPEDLKINGRIVIDNDLRDFDQLSVMLERVADGRTVCCLHAGKEPADAAMLRQLKAAAGENGKVASHAIAGQSQKKLAAAIDAAHVVYVQPANEHHKTLLELREAFAKLIEREGMLVMSAEDAGLLGKFTPPEPGGRGGFRRPAPMMNLMPDCVIYCQQEEEDPFRDDERYVRDFFDFLEDNPPLVGVSIAHNAALVLTGRKLNCVGRGRTTLMLPKAKGNRQEQRTESIGRYVSRRQNPLEYVADLTAWRRDAMDRDLPPFPPRNPQTPDVTSGALLIVGGGGSPRGLMNRFIELAGGVENAKLVYIPCSEDEDVGLRHGIVEGWKRMGVKHATFIHTKDRRRADRNDKFLEPLKDATGLFFGGGRQWNFSDSYYGTKAHQLMKNVLRRGGVIAGSSAGASIQARYLARATPIGNWRIMAPGYERGGLGFISGVAIDQHFSQRGRQKDMEQLMRVHPQLLGIGIDESTAIEVQRSTATVTGRGSVYFYDAARKGSKEQPAVTALKAGEAYDLAKRRQVKK